MRVCDRHLRMLYILISCLLRLKWVYHILYLCCPSFGFHNSEPYNAMRRNIRLNGFATMTVFSVSCLQVGRAWSCLEWWIKELVRLWWFCQWSSDSFLHSVISSMRSSRASLELLPILISCLHSDSKCFEHVLRQSNSIPQHDGRGMVLFHLILSMIGWLKCYITILKELSIHKRRASRLNANTVLFRPAY